MVFLTGLLCRPSLSIRRAHDALASTLMLHTDLNSHANISRHKNSNCRLIHWPQPRLHLHRKKILHKPDSKPNPKSPACHTTSTTSQFAGSSDGWADRRRPTSHDQSVNVPRVEQSLYADYELRLYNRHSRSNSAASTSPLANTIASTSTMRRLSSSAPSPNFQQGSGQVLVTIVEALYRTIILVQVISLQHISLPQCS